MVFEKTKENVFEFCKTWLKSDVAKGVSQYYDNFEKYSEEHIQNDIDEYKKAIDSLKQRSEALKKEIKKDKEKKKALDEVKNHLEDSMQALKDKRKELETLPQRIKQIKAEFQDSMKELSHLIDEVAKLRGQDAKVKDKENVLQHMQDLLVKLSEVNKIAKLDEIIKGANMEFKLENEGGEKKLKDYKKLLVMLHESIGARWFDIAANEKLGTKKAEYLKHVCTEFAFASSASKEDNFDVDYYAGLLAYTLGTLIISLGIQQVERYEYTLATQYFLKARELLLDIKKGSKLDKLGDEQIALARAYASDTYNTIYLLNSYANWKMIAKNTADAELKDIASISVKNIEEWVTKQYGFPPEDKISSILNAMIWPTPQMPPEMAEFVAVKADAKGKSSAGGTVVIKGKISKIVENKNKASDDKKAKEPEPAKKPAPGQDTKGKKSKEAKGKGKT
nr:hypothetical protein [Candidatus Sigynarchaeota archaeon]